MYKGQIIIQLMPLQNCFRIISIESYNYSLSTYNYFSPWSNKIRHNNNYDFYCMNQNNFIKSINYNDIDYLPNNINLFGNLGEYFFNKISVYVSPFLHMRKCTLMGRVNYNFTRLQPDPDPLFQFTTSIISRPSCLSIRGMGTGCNP